MTVENESRLNIFTETKLSKDENEHNFDIAIRSGTCTPHVVLKKIKSHKKKRRKIRKNKSVTVTTCIKRPILSKKSKKFPQFNILKSK